MGVSCVILADVLWNMGAFIPSHLSLMKAATSVFTAAGNGLGRSCFNEPLKDAEFVLSCFSEHVTN